MLPQLVSADPEGLEAYFTDVEHLREAFKARVAAPAIPRRMLVVHGVGGVGKSSLLWKMPKVIVDTGPVVHLRIYPSDCESIAIGGTL